MNKKKRNNPRNKCHDAFPRLSTESASDCKTVSQRYSSAALGETHASM